jgi:hypothetical protein
MRRLALIVVAVLILSAMLTAEGTTEYHIQKATRTQDKVTVWLTTPGAEYVLSCEIRFAGCVIFDDRTRYTFDTVGELALFSLETAPNLYVVKHAFNIVAVTYLSAV